MEGHSGIKDFSVQIIDVTLFLFSLSQEYKPLVETDMEMIATELFKSNNKPVILYTFYRPSNFTPDVFQSLNNSPKKNKESNHIVMIGDFNL